jgi:4-amino-4-deoxy-L-arabinose transferase-like glycosyltransferase
VLSDGALAKSGDDVDEAPHDTRMLDRGSEGAAGGHGDRPAVRPPHARRWIRSVVRPLAWVMASCRRLAFATGVLALVARVPLLGGATIYPDSGSYLAAGHDLITGNGFASTEDYRTAAYPLYLALAELLPASTPTAAAAGQHLLGVAFSVAVVVAAWRYFGRFPALISGLLVACTPYVSNVEHTIMPDFPFTVAVFAGAVTLTEAALRKPASYRLLALSGVVFGLAAHVKPNGQALIMAAPIVLAVTTRTWWPTIAGSLVVAATALAVMSPWILRNQLQFGHPLMSVQGGQALYLRAFDLDHLPFPTDVPEARFAKKIYDRTYAGQPPGIELPSYTPVFVALRAKGYSAHDATGLMGTMAMTAIRRHPVDYAEGTGKNLARFQSLWQERPYRDVEVFTGRKAMDDAALPTQLRSVASAISQLSLKLLPLWWYLSLGGLAGLALLFVPDHRCRTAATVFASLWFVVALATSLTNHVEVRFFVQAAPLMWILGSAGAVFLTAAVLRRLHDLREGTVP